ncbi:hypothetical protein ACTFBT_00945 [Streptomyces microflavus]
MPLSRFELRRTGSPFVAAADMGDGHGRRYLFFATEEVALMAARKLNGDPPPREERLLQLSRDIEALEAWHHAWRLEHDVDYRELHPGEWCERHGKLLKSCYCRSNYRRFTELLYTEPYEIRTGDGTIIRRRPAQRAAPELTLEVRRAATRTMAKWGSGR